MKLKNKLLLIAGTAVTAVSLAIGSMFGGPSELLDDAPTAIVMQAETAAEAAEDTAVPPEKKRGWGRVSQWFIRLPLWLRVTVVLPLWLLGRFLILLGSWLASAAATPLGGAILGFIGNALVIAGICALVFKLLFPNRKVKELFTKRNLALMLAGAVLLSVADAVVPLLWEKYEAVKLAVLLVLSLGVAAGLWYLLWRRKHPGLRPFRVAMGHTEI